MASIAEQLSGALTPHTLAIGKTLKDSGGSIEQILREILETNKQIARSGRPDWADKWNYCNFGFSGAGAAQDFSIPVVVPENEVWLVQHITLGSAATVTATTDGGQFRGTAINLGTTVMSGNVAWLPGEHILIAASAAVVGTIGVLRRLNGVVPRDVNAGRSNEMYSGQFNTHEIARDVILENVDPWVEPDPETRATEGLERNEQPVVLVGSVNGAVDPRRSLTGTQDPTV